MERGALGNVDGGDAGAHLAVLAREPRPAGSAVEARARAYAARELARHGFSVEEEPFVFSAFPGRWGTPMAGIVSALALAVAAPLGAHGRSGAALALLVASLAAIAIGGTWLARRGVTALGAMRETSTNLVARRGDEAPRVWLVAHLDSKSQPVPMLVRAGGITLCAIAWLASIGLALAALLGGCTGSCGASAWTWVGTIGVVASLPIALSTVGARSPGALDNASGVATVLASLALVPRDLPLGVLLPSAEELGLAGARIWVRGPRAGIVVNVDGVDDEGAVIAMWSGRRPTRLLEEAAMVGDALAVPVRPRRLLPGVLTDGVAFADAGWEAITLSKGTTRTLARIHRPGDSLAQLRGDGAWEVARLVAALATRLSTSRRG